MRAPAMEMVDGDREIRVGEKDRGAARGEHAAPRRESLAAIGGVAKHAQCEAEVFAGAARDLRGRVRAAVVDDDQLRVRTAFAQIEMRGDALESAAQAIRLLVGGDDDRQRKSVVRRSRIVAGSHRAFAHRAILSRAVGAA